MFCWLVIGCKNPFPGVGVAVIKRKIINCDDDPSLNSFKVSVNGCLRIFAFHCIFFSSHEILLEITESLKNMRNRQ